MLAGATAFSVALWVRLDAVDTWSRVFDFGTGTTAYMFLTPRSSAGTARFAVTTTGSGGEQRLDAPAALAAGKWIHVAVTAAGGTGTLYVDGAQVARATGMTLRPATSAPPRGTGSAARSTPATPTCGARSTRCGSTAGR
nr:LamG domain-containing protein [Microbispora sp. GKU 823]